MEAGNQVIMGGQKLTIAIEEALIYEDMRGHFIFNDKSALILHPGGGDCFTYFTPDGKKTRMLTKFAIKKADSILEKLLLAINFVNTFGDEPLPIREETFPERI